MSDSPMQQLEAEPEQMIAQYTVWVKVTSDIQDDKFVDWLDTNEDIVEYEFLDWYPAE